MQVGPGVFRAESAGEVIYALDCGDAYALIDVGTAPEFPAKLDQLQQDGLDPERIAAVLITHHHRDHAGALARVRAELSPRIVAHRLSVEQLPHCTASAPIASDLVDYTVDDGDTVEIGNTSLQVHHLPGHTADSVVWQLGRDFFVGDVIFCDGGIGWMDVHWGSCVTDYRSSLQRLLRLKASNIYPGHRQCGPITRDTISHALKNLNQLAEADGSPLAYIGHSAPRRASDEPAKIIRLSTSPPRPDQR